MGHGGETGFFKDPGKHAHGVGAEGSSGGQEDQVNAFVLETLCDLGSGLFGHDRAVAEGAHEGVVVGRDGSDNAALRQFPHTIHGEGDVDVPVDGGAVEADAEVTLNDVGRVGVAGG